MRQVVSGSQTNAGTGAEAPMVTTTADGVPSDPAAQSAAPPLQQAALAAGGAAQVQHRLSGRLAPLSIMSRYRVGCRTASPHTSVWLAAASA
jgi:hypothetical protein